MSVRRCLAALALLASASLAQGEAQEDLTSDQWNEVVGFIDEMLGTARSGSDNSRTIGRDLAVSVVPQKALSRSTGAICSENCYDPCRGFDLSVTRDGGRSIFQYSGRRCASSADFSTWGPDGTITLDRVLRAGPDPELVAGAASYLTALGYLPKASGTPDAERTMAALRAFRGDAQGRSPDDEDITSVDLEALRATLDRSQARATCAVPPRTGFAACETSSF